MHNTTVSSLNSTTLRTGILTATSAVAMLSLGFAPFPALYYLLGASLLAVVVIVSTDPTMSQPIATLPLGLTIGVPAVVAILFRGTSLVLAIVPVLALVVASATWMFVSTRYNANTVAAEPAGISPIDESSSFATADELTTKRHEKAAATNDDTSATAA